MKRPVTFCFARYRVVEFKLIGAAENTAITLIVIFLNEFIVQAINVSKIEIGNRLQPPGFSDNQRAILIIFKNNDEK